MEPGFNGDFEDVHVEDERPRRSKPQRGKAKKARGKRGKVRVVLTKAACKALAGRTGTTRFTVTVRENGRTTRKTIVARYTAKQGKTGSAKGK